MAATCAVVPLLAQLKSLITRSRLNYEDTNSSTVTNILYSYFDIKKGKLIWTGSLETLKAFVLTEVDEATAERTTWRSPGAENGYLTASYCQSRGQRKARIFISTVRGAVT